MLYRPPTAPPSSIAARHLTGRELAYWVRGMSARGRGNVAAALVKGELTVIGPTLRQAARLARANSLYAREALHGAKPPTDATIDRIVARIGPDRIWAALDRATCPAEAAE